MVTLNEYDYDALVAWARHGAASRGDSLSFAALQKKIDAANGVQRYTLLVSVKTMPVKDPSPGFVSDEALTLELRRPITKDDVLERLRELPIVPQQVYVTRDLAGDVGWYELEAFPF